MGGGLVIVLLTELEIGDEMKDFGIVEGCVDVVVRVEVMDE